MKTSLVARDWTLLTIAAAGDQALQPVQLQKSLFLIGESLFGDGHGPFYEFVPFDYGPFCADIYKDAEALELNEFIRIGRPPLTRFKTYAVTEKGRTQASQLRTQLLSATDAAFVDEVVRFTLELSFNDLVGAIYRKYPEMKSHSVFRG